MSTIAAERLKVGDRVRLTREGREVAQACDGDKEWCLDNGEVSREEFAGCIEVRRMHGRARRREVWAARFWERTR